MHRRLGQLAVGALLAGSVAVSPLAAGTGTAARGGLSLSIVGRHFVDGSGHAIRLLGVNHTSSEYGCVDGFGYDDGHFDNTDAAAIRSWGANAVRIPLNEDCWLGLNGQPNSSEGADPPLTAAGYQQEIKRYVGELNAHSLYAILDLHWTAPGSQIALEQQPMPDQDHSPAFWTSVATTFKTNPAVAFDLFNEPYDPTDLRSGEDPNQEDKVSWNCWETGTENGPAGGEDCFTAAYDEDNMETTRYQVAGLQTLLNAIRATGAKQPVLAGGLDYANDLGDTNGGKAWMSHAPNDPLNREAASFHNYQGEPCGKQSCWSHTIAPIAQHVPVVTGEFDEDNFDEPKCSHTTPSTFDARYMKWADGVGVSYLAWGWIVETKGEQDRDGCSAFVLIKNYSTHTPAPPNGVALHDHLRVLAEGPVPLATFGAAVVAGNHAVRYRLRTPVKSSGALTAKTAHTYSVGGGKRRHVSLGGAHFSLEAARTKGLVARLPAAAHNLLLHRHSLKAVVTITLTATGHRRTVLHRTVRFSAS